MNLKIKIIIPLLLTCLLVQSGCIFENSKQNKILIAEVDDLKLIITSNESIINNKSSHIWLTITLTNINDKPVKIDSRFNINSTITIKVSNVENNCTYSNVHLDQVMNINYMIINPNENKILNLDLKNDVTLLNITGDPKEIFNFDINGNYSIIAFYRHSNEKPLLESNKVYLELE